MSSASQAYLLERDVLTQLMQMHKGRQNFAMLSVKKRKPRSKEVDIHVYVIGGFNLKEKALNHVERYCLE